MRRGSNDRGGARTPQTLLFACLVIGGCGKTTASSDAGRVQATTAAAASAAPSTSTRRPPPCEPWIVSPLEVPADWRTFPIVATSEAAVRIDTRSVDHYVDELIDVPIGPFVLRYWHGLTRPTASDLVLRLAGCEGAPLTMSARPWDGGTPLTLRMKESVFIVSARQGDETLVAVVRRLPK